MNEQRMQFAIGIVTLIAGFALAAIIIWFGEFQFAFESTRTYYVLFKDAAGAEVGVPVRRAGIRIGEVRDVQYSDEYSLVVVTLSVESRYELRKGDEPTIQRSLFGDSFVDVKTPADLQGKPDRPLIANDATIEGKSPLDPTQTIEEATTLVPNTNKTMVDLQRASKTWNDVGERTNRLLRENERKLNQILEETLDSTERLSVTLESVNNMLDPKTQENFRVVMKNLRDRSDEMKPLMDQSTKAIEQIGNTTAKLDEVAGNLKTATKPIAERSESLVKNLDESAQSLNLLLADLRVMTDNFKKQDGTLQRLMKDPAIYQNLDDASVLLVTNLIELEIGRAHV